MSTDDWRHEAACAGPQYAKHGELWFPNPADEEGRKAAIRVCRTCPVIQQCRDWALDSRQDAGIWGGLDERERRALLRRQGRIRRQAARCGTRPGYKKHHRDGTPVCERCQIANAEHGVERYHANKETAA